jgi:type I restriction enzyme, S subunit
MISEKLGMLSDVKTGKLDANAQVLHGQYPFFTCSVENKRIDSYAFDGEYVIVAGNGDLNVKYYSGKFNAYQRTYAIKPNNKIHGKYLYYFLEKYLEKLRELSIGGVIKYIKLGNLTEAKIPLPSLDQQKKIAAILDAADAYRQKTKALITKYDELTQSLFLDMFGDPVSNPKGWEINILKNHLIDVKNGITRRPKTEEDKSGQIVLKLKHIRSNFINYDCDNRILLENSEKTKFSVNIGDLLFIRVNGNPDYVGRCALHDNNKYEVFFNDHIMRVRVDLNTFNSLFLCQYLNYPYGQREISKRVKTSAGQYTINQGGLDKLNLIVPPLELQNQFAERVQAIEAQRAQAQASFAQAEDLFNSLLQRVFKGELTS